MRFRVDIAYHGGGFHGWQRQPDLRTVQGELESWLSRLLAGGDTVTLIGSGRTDAGAHAERMVAHFDWLADLDAERLTRRLRVALPDDMVVSRIVRVSDEFHARYCACARHYRYRIRLGRFPFNRDREWQLPGSLDVGSMLECSPFVLGAHDFSGFCRTGAQAEDRVCAVVRSEWIREGDCLDYWVTADRFLHEMVRLLVGTYVAIGRGRWSPNHIGEILKSRDVRLCGDAAPAHGLTLMAVDYPAGVGEPTPSGA